MNRAEVLRRIEELAVVPVVRAPSAETALAAVYALLAGGLSVFEITLTVPGALGVIEELVTRLGDRAVIGAGTVLSADSALDATKAGAAFVVSPGLDLRTVEAMRTRDIAVFPGALTPTEILTAWNAGADVVKVFPCSALGGAKYLTQLRGPFPDIRLLPTGGVNVSNAAEFLRAGAIAVGLGTDLVDVAAVEHGRAHVLTERTRALLESLRPARTTLI
jgi:2-dehydro-3-deoxyphosphogluconate aldolase / (4S)-4-hydroxy-2-oxoglutarate aldolase